MNRVFKVSDEYLNLIELNAIITQFLCSYGQMDSYTKSDDLPRLT